MIIKEESTFTPAPVGTHLACGISIIDIGTQDNEYMGLKSKKHQIIIAWELPHELQERGEKAGKPFTISKFYNFSFNEKATLRKDLESWRGRSFTDVELRGFDVASILGKWCQITIIANSNGKHAVSAVTGTTKGTVFPAQVNPSLIFDMTDFRQDVFDGLSDGIKNMIKKSDEWAQLQRGGSSQAADAPDANEDPDSWVPF